MVFVLAEGNVDQRIVELGWREADWVEITGGLEAEDEVVVEGAALLSDGSQVVAARKAR